MTYFSRGRITAFADALSHALYDHAIARERDILFLCDSDVISRMVFGRYAPNRDRVDSRDELVEALLSAGYLGVAHLLRPHAIELHSLIKRFGEESEASATGVSGEYEQQVRMFLESRGATDGVKALLEAINSSPSTEIRTKRFLDVLKDVGAPTFVAVELAHGTWQERIRRLHGRVLNFSDIGDAMRSLLNEPDVWKLFHDITRHRKHKDKTVNNLIDASALVALRRLVDIGKRTTTQPLVRFYTTSPSLLRLIGDPSEEGLRRELTYDIGDEWRMERARNAGFVLRTTDYYMIRASFEALQFPKVREEHFMDRPAPISVAELEDVLRELTSAIASTGPTNDKALLEVLEMLKIGDRELIDVIHEIEQASFLERLLGDSLAIPASLKMFVDEFDAVFAFVTTGEPREQMRIDILHDAELLTRSLVREGPNLRGHIRIVRRVRERIAVLAKSAKEEHDFEVSEPDRDLGLVRWGGELEEVEAQFVIRVVRQLFSDDERQILRACGDIAEIFVEPPSESMCLAVCGVLWMLSLFDLVVETINSFARRLPTNQIPVALTLMRTAARVRAKHSFSIAEKRDHVDGLEAGVQRLNDQDGRLFLGLAYVAYGIARSEKEDVGSSPAEDETDAAAELRAPWAVRSFMFGERALAMLPPESLAAAFAINHCAYLGAMAGIFPRRTDEYLKALAAFQSAPRLWNYRFADTLAFVKYTVARRTWSRSLEVGGSQTAPMLLTVCKLLTEARRLIDTAHPNFGDLEIPEHLEEIGRLQLQAGCLIT